MCIRDSPSDTPERRSWHTRAASPRARGVRVQPVEGIQVSLHERRGLAQQVELGAYKQVPALDGLAILRRHARQVVQPHQLLVVQ
eukprot:1908780-Pyramimonas_sp.AAC.1